MTTESPTISEFRQELAKKIADAVVTELRIRKLEYSENRAVDVEALARAQHVCSDPLDTDHAQDLEAIQSSIKVEKEDISLTLNALQREKDRIVQDLSQYPETYRSALEHFYFPADGLALFTHGQKLITWVEDVRNSCLIPLETETQVLLHEKQKRDARRKVESAAAQLIRDDMASCQKHIKDISCSLEEIKRNISFKGKPSTLDTTILPDFGSTNLLEGMQENAILPLTQSEPSNTTDTFADRLDKIKGDLLAFRDSRSASEVQMSALQGEFGKALRPRATVPQQPLVEFEPEIATLVDQLVQEAFPDLVSMFDPAFAQYRDSDEINRYFQCEAMEKPHRLVHWFLLSPLDGDEALPPVQPKDRVLEEGEVLDAYSALLNST